MKTNSLNIGIPNGDNHGRNYLAQSHIYISLICRRFIIYDKYYVRVFVCMCGEHAPGNDIESKMTR